MTNGSTTRGRLLLIAGALLGLALAASDLVKRASEESQLSDDVVALVDGRPILRAEYERALAAVAVDRREGQLTAGDRQRVLERLIDEELLVQRAIQLGLAERDRIVRANLTSAVIGLITTGAEEELVEPSDAELRTFYAANADWFRVSPRYRLEQVYFRVASSSDDASGRQRAQAARDRLVGGELMSAVAVEGDAPAVPLPQGLASARQLRESVGPTVATAVAELEVGSVSEPLRSGTGYHVVRMVERIDGDLPAFDSIREVVRQEYVRRAGERRLRRFLDQRRLEVAIQVAPELE